MGKCIKASLEVMAVAAIAIICGWAGTISLPLWIGSMILIAVVLIGFIFYLGNRLNAEEQLDKRKDEKWVRILKDLSEW